MIHFFSFLTHTKVAKIFPSGGPDNNQPFGILLKGFFLFINILPGKKDFWINLSYKKNSISKNIKLIYFSTKLKSRLISYNVFLFIIIERRFIKINSHRKNAARKEIVFVNLWILTLKILYIENNHNFKIV